MTTSPLFKRVPVEDLGWLICEAAQGGGRGKCDPGNCVCHGEAARLIELFRKHGLTLTASPEPPAEEVETLRERVKELERLYRERTELAEAQRRRAEAAEAKLPRAKVSG